MKLRSFPWRNIGRSPYEILVAEILLKRTTATAAASVYERFLMSFPSVSTLNRTSEERLVEALSTIGLQQQRAKAIKNLALWLSEKHGGAVPCNLKDLLNTPGLGEYSARAIMSFGCDVPLAVVDSNVERILERVFQGTLPERPTRSLLQRLAELMLPQVSHRMYNFGLLDLGAIVCRYTDPDHEECPLASICDYRSFHESKRVGKRGTRIDMEAVRLKKIRQKQGVSLVSLSKASGVSKLTIIRIESGKTSPLPLTLKKLAVALGVEPTELGVPQ